MRLSELRSNPSKNIKQSAYDQLMAYRGKPVYFSLQRIKKLGINPKFNFEGSPLGIYSYYLPAVIGDLEKQGRISKALPFASERPYIFVFEVDKSANLLDVEKYSLKDLVVDLKKIKPKIEDEYEGGYMGFLKHLQKIRQTNYTSELLILTLQEMTDSNPILLRRYLVDMGYDGIVDNVGSKVTFGAMNIKESIFFSTEKIRILDMIINSNVSDDDKIYKDGQETSIDFNDNAIIHGQPKKKIKVQKRKTGKLEVIDPGLSIFAKGDLISQDEYEQQKPYGLEVR